MIETLIFIIGYLGLLFTCGWFNLLTLYLFVFDALKFIFIISILRNIIKIPFYIEITLMAILIGSTSAISSYYNFIDDGPIDESNIEFLIMHSGLLTAYSIICMVSVYFYNIFKTKQK